MVLPTNLSGTEVRQLQNYHPQQGFAYWLPPPPPQRNNTPPAPEVQIKVRSIAAFLRHEHKLHLLHHRLLPGQPGCWSQAPRKAVLRLGQRQAPPFYDVTPPAPPGLLWWRTKADVPPLPDPVEALGPAFARYGWRYDQSSQSRSYTFTDLDTVSGLHLRAALSTMATPA